MTLTKKETLPQVFSFEFCEISKNIFYRTPQGDCENDFDQQIVEEYSEFCQTSEARAL